MEVICIGFMTVSTASLLSEGILMRPSSSLTSNPTRNIFEKYFCMINWILAKPQANNVFEARTCSQWKDFYRSMFWLAIFYAGLIFLQVFLLVMKLRKTIYETQGSYGALTFPRFEIFLTFFALPSLSMASGALFRGEGL